MDRTTFEALRDLPGKTISGDIRFVRRAALAPVLVAEGIRIDNAGGVELLLSVSYNEIVGSKTINVHVPGVGPVCRLDVDGNAHRPAGRSHKHSLHEERCPDRNLPDGIVDRPDLVGTSLRMVFAEFCRMANIVHLGHLETPDEAS
jgi:hypothetical protein